MIFDFYTVPITSNGGELLHHLRVFTSNKRLSVPLECIYGSHIEYRGRLYTLRTVSQPTRTREYTRGWYRLPEQMAYSVYLSAVEITLNDL